MPVHLRSARLPDISPYAVCTADTLAAVPDSHVGDPGRQHTPPPVTPRTYSVALPTTNKASRIQHLMTDPVPKGMENPIDPSPLLGLPNHQFRNLIPLVSMCNGRLLDILESLGRLVLDIRSLATGCPKYEPLDDGQLHLLHSVITSTLLPCCHVLSHGILVLSASAITAHAPSFQAC